MPLSPEQKIQIWERAIQTQMHFAELSIKMRQIGLTLAGGTIALVVVLYRTAGNYSLPLPFCSWELPVASILILGAAAILYAAKLIDVGVYHRMLRGAVRFNELWEQKMDLDAAWFTGMTESISAHSRYTDPQLLECRNDKGKFWISSKSKEEKAGNRIETFYWFCISALAIVAVILFLAENFK